MEPWAITILVIGIVIIVAAAIVLPLIFIKKPSPPVCQNNGQCPNNQICQNGQCVPSSQCSPPCPAGQMCQNGRCILSPQCSPSQPCPAGQVCQNGQCVQSPQCSPSQPCPAGQTCQNGQCVLSPQCSPSQPCPAGQTCQNGQCVTPSTPCSPFQPCPFGQTCLNGQCVTQCSPAEPCPGGQVCQNGQCVTPSPSPQCSPSQPCPSGQKCCSNACQQCCTTNDCPSGQVCQEGQCVTPSGCQSSNDCTDSATPYCCQVSPTLNQCRQCCLSSQCPANNYCDASGTCQPLSAQCQQDSDCNDPTKICINNECVTGCRTNTQCPSGQVCQQNQCVPTTGTFLPPGQYTIQYLPPAARARLVAATKRATRNGGNTRNAPKGNGSNGGTNVNAGDSLQFVEPILIDPNNELFNVGLAPNSTGAWSFNQSVLFWPAGPLNIAPATTSPPSPAYLTLGSESDPSATGWQLYVDSTGPGKILDIQFPAGTAVVYNAQTSRFELGAKASEASFVFTKVG